MGGYLQIFKNCNTGSVFVVSYANIQAIFSLIDFVWFIIFLYQYTRCCNYLIGMYVT